MNIIQIVSDTFRRDHLGCHGNYGIHTENLDRFAKQSVVFDKAYIASFPTIPNRHDLFTGRYTFIYSMWSPLPRDEVILSQLLRQAGYTTMLIVDTPHMIRDASYFDRGFDGWWWMRGQEQDRYMTNPTKDSVERREAFGTQYLQNVSSRRFEEDYFVAQTMTSAAKWLELNYDQHEKFFLHVDTFDPHEPWDPPKWYADMYDPDWKGGEVAGGAYVRGVNRLATSDLTEDELNHLRALYAGEVTMVDRWVGMLLNKIEDLGLFENTAVIFTADHGTYLGEHGYVGKRDHLYEEVTHIPLIVRMPDSEGNLRSRCGAIVQSPDLTPTILHLAEVPPPPTVQGRSILPAAQGEETQDSGIAVSSPSLIRRTLPSWITVTSEEWALLAARINAPTQVESELYNLSKDPSETQNLYYKEAEVAEQLRSKMIEFLRSKGAEEEILQNWAKQPATES
jgi:arylsulfatase A-like enzyme